MEGYQRTKICNAIYSNLIDNGGLIRNQSNFKTHILEEMSPKSSVSLVWSKFVGCVKNARIVSLTEDAEEGKGGGFPFKPTLFLSQSYQM